MSDPALNALTVGLRSDGMISLMSGPTGAGPHPATINLLTPDQARWLVRELLQCIDRAAMPGNGAGKESG